MNQDYPTKIGTCEVVKQPELMESLSVFKSQNEYTGELLVSIKSKLTTIFKYKENPQDPPGEEKIVESVVDEFKYQLKRQREHNDRLNSIFSHLAEIV